MNAKKGDAIQTKARRVLQKALGAPSVEVIQSTVAAKTPGDRGQWFCIDCGELPANQLSAGSHESAKPTHRLAWRSFISGAIEAP